MRIVKNGVFVAVGCRSKIDVDVDFLSNEIEVALCLVAFLSNGAEIDFVKTVHRTVTMPCMFYPTKYKYKLTSQIYTFQI